MQKWHLTNWLLAEWRGADLSPFKCKKIVSKVHSAMRCQCISPTPLSFWRFQTCSTLLKLLWREEVLGCITGCNILTNWHYHCVMNKWHLTYWLLAEWRSADLSSFKCKKIVSKVHSAMRCWCISPTPLSFWRFQTCSTLLKLLWREEVLGGIPKTPYNHSKIILHTITLSSSYDHLTVNLQSP